MLEGLLDALIEARNSGDGKAKERAYRNLEKVGVDRTTANVLAGELVKERAKKRIGGEML